MKIPVVAWPEIKRTLCSTRICYVQAIYAILPLRSCLSRNTCNKERLLLHFVVFSRLVVQKEKSPQSRETSRRWGAIARTVGKGERAGGIVDERRHVRIPRIRAMAAAARPRHGKAQCLPFSAAGKCMYAMFTRACIHELEVKEQGDIHASLRKEGA